MEIPAAYQEVSNLVFQYGGCLFGGCIRDFLSGVTPKDIDVSVSDSQVQDFQSALQNLGFHVANDKGTTLSKDGIVVDVSERADDCELAVDLYVPADFDVNTLAFDGTHLFNFWNPIGEFDITEILKKIPLHQAKSLNPTPQRTQKMLEKGWTII